MPLEQQMASLRIANERRRIGAGVAQEIGELDYTDGLRRVAELLTANDERIQSMRVGRLVRSVHRVGERAVLEILWEAGIRFGDKQVRLIGGLNRTALATVLVERAEAAERARKVAA